MIRSPAQISYPLRSIVCNTTLILRAVLQSMYKTDMNSGPEIGTDSESGFEL